MTQEAAGSEEVSLSPNLKTNLVAQSRQQWDPSEGTWCPLVPDLPEPKADKAPGAKRTGLI